MTGPAPVVLAGRHVRLEPLTPAHAAGLAAAGAGDRSSFALTTVPDGDISAAAYIAALLADADAGSALPFATALPDGEVVGATRFLDLQYWPIGDGRGRDVPVVAEIGGTWLAPEVQRSAVNTEAKLLMLAHAFETWRVRRVSLKTDARNARSRAAIERLGARFDGVLRAHTPAVDGGLRDSAFYSILDTEWSAVRARLTCLLSRDQESCRDHGSRKPP
jgi:RimJ/RimL family protein N-acetyltransferase